MINDAKPIRKVLNLLRKMDNAQRFIVLDWLNDWYEYLKEYESEEEDA